MYKFTVAIPTFNSSDYLKECILGFRNSKFVDEILIGDDCSDRNELSNVESIIQETRTIMNCEIKLIKNKNNIGAFKNKYNLIINSKNEWVYQIDSDNVPFKNIDGIIKNIIDENSGEKYIYYPTKLIQFRKYKKIAKVFSTFQKKYRVVFSNKSLIINMEKTKEAVLENVAYEEEKEASEDSDSFPELDSKFFKEKHIFWVLNCGNFIANKKPFKKNMKKGLNYERDLLSMDAVVFSYLWLLNNGSIKLIQGLSHYHRKRYDSVSYTEIEPTIKSRQYFTNKIINKE